MSNVIEASDRFHFLVLTIYLFAPAASAGLGTYRGEDTFDAFSRFHA